METIEQQNNLVDIIAVLKRRSTLLISTGMAIFLIGATLALVLPSIYRSEAVILIERQEIPTDLVRSTITTYAEQRIQVISQRVMNSVNLMRIIDQFNLYADEKLNESREEILERMKSNISLEMISASVVDPRSGKPTEATIAFSLAFEDENAQKAQRVANDLVSSFLNENIKSRTESATETASFLNDEAEVLRNRVSDLEKEIANFKDENPLNRPELEGLTRDMMNRAELQLSEIDRRTHGAMQNKIYLEGQLALHDPTLARDVGFKSSSLEQQTRAVQAQLATAEAAYGDTHPDVIRLRQTAAAMRATLDPESARVMYDEQITSAQAKLNELLERYGETHPDIEKARKTVENLQGKLNALPPPTERVPDNPSYVGLTSRIEAVNSELRSFAEQRKEMIKKLETYAESLIAMPDVEAQYRELDRDYETAILKYREISAKQMEARISQNLESDRKGEKFSLIEPPLEATDPARPNRPAILFASLVLGLFGSFGVASLVEAMDDKIRGRQSLQAIFSSPPLASIPVIDVGDGRSELRRYAIPMSGVLVAIIVATVIVHVMVMPVDVLWFTILRKAGL